MSELRVCFVGIGSIARRHIRNLKSICNEKGLSLMVDAVRRNAMKGNEDEELGIQEVFTNVSDLKPDYDAIFITNPTEYHIDTLNAVHNRSKHFFLEKPVASIAQLEKAKRFPLRDDSVYYVAAPLRYHAVIQYIREQLDLSSILSVRAISSSYLPTWRPGVDYRTTYSAQKELGGGVSIDLIHEWDYLTYLFGEPIAVRGMIGKKSKLEIDSDDIAVYIAEYPHMIAELHLDYFGRKTLREIQLITESETIIGDLVNQRITFLISGQVVEFKEERDDFQKRELRHFLELIDNGVGHEEISHAVNVLKLSQGG